MTLFTLHRLVLSNERVAARVVVETQALETFDDVAAAAVFLELTEMGPILVTVATSRECDAPVPLVTVAGLAGQIAVHAGQGITGLLVVEGADVPGAFVVALPAITSQRGPVRVLVAVGARREAQAVPSLVGMAALAGDSTVGPDEGKARPTVVEIDVVEFDVERVASLAIGAEPLLVNVGVTGDTTPIIQEEGLRFRTARGVRRPMALVTARDGQVEPDQRIAGLFVIEGRSVPAKQIERLPLMLDVTGGTVARFPAMETPSLSDASGELLVASQTFVVTDALTGRVTAGAIRQAGELRMHVAQCPRRHERVESLGLRGADCADHPQPH